MSVKNDAATVVAKAERPWPRPDAGCGEIVAHSSNLTK